MAYDIYGEPLRYGHCEVHPHVHEKYPCSVCLAEKAVNDQRQNQAHKALEVEYNYEQVINQLLDMLENCTGNDAEQDTIRHHLLKQHGRED